MSRARTRGVRRIKDPAYGLDITTGMIVKIDKGIPVPPKGKRESEYTKTIMKMEPGDSVFCETQEEREAYRHAFYQRGIPYTLRKRDEDGRKGWRIWRRCINGKT